MNVDIATGFSNPLEPFDDGFRAWWVRAIYHSRIEAFLDRWLTELRNNSDGLDVALTNFDASLARGDREIEVEIAWHPFCNLAPIDEVDTNSTTAALSRAMQFALRLSEFEPGVAASVRLPAAVSLGFSDYKLPRASEVRLSGSDTETRIELSSRGDWRTLLFERRHRDFCLVSGEAEKQPKIEFAGRAIAIYPLARSIERTDEKVIPAEPEMVEVLRDALALVDQVSPAYRAWIARMLRVVVPLRPIYGQFNSETFASLNGTAFISLHPDVVRTAETLVHEVSHDYLHMLNMMDPLAEASGAEMFYSPVRECRRPTLAILKAQHAFVNVLLFYYLMQLAEVPLEGQYVRGVAKLEGWRSDLEDALSRARSLTEFGDCLWRSLSRRADQFRLLAASMELAATA